MALACPSDTIPSSSEPSCEVWIFPEVPASLKRRSPRSSTLACRMRQLLEKNPFSTAGSSSSIDVSAYRSTNPRPAVRAASRTDSASSARPSITAGSTSGRYFWKALPRHCGRYRKRVRLPSRTGAPLAPQCATTSGSSSTRCSSPSTVMTSARPCAAPLRSTLLVSARMVARSQGMRSLNDSCPMPLTRLPSALAAMALTSGMGSTRALLSSGIRSGT
mmetsp:Transcript_65317/g.206335  ORF Transcript_65317/g.206335 Transcript_65317/m.206335 type:complete len:219 (+) Transcript_65317:176-832(+)